MTPETHKTSGAKELLPLTATIDLGATVESCPIDHLDDSLAKELSFPDRASFKQTHQIIRERFTDVLMGSNEEKQYISELFTKTCSEERALAIREIASDRNNKFNRVAVTSVRMLGEMVVPPLLDIIKESGKKRVEDRGIFALKVIEDFGTSVQELGSETRRELKSVLSDLLAEPSFCISRAHATRIAGNLGPWHGHSLRKVLINNANSDRDSFLAQISVQALEQVSGWFERATFRVGLALKTVRGIFPKI